jgi:hypothetical protein
VLHNAERIPHLVEAIFDEYFQRMQLADQYQREIDATGGWTHMGGSDNIRRQLEKIKSANLAASRRLACQFQGGLGAISDTTAGEIGSSRCRESAFDTKAICLAFPKSLRQPHSYSDLIL